MWTTYDKINGLQKGYRVMALEDVGQGAGQGAAAGSSFGPKGALIGAGIGAATSFIGGGASGRARNKAAKRQRRFLQGQLQQRQTGASNQRLRMLLGLTPRGAEEQGQIDQRGFASNPFAQAISQAGLEGATRGIRSGRQALLGSLGRSGVGGGLAARAAGQFERESGERLGKFRGQEAALTQQFEQQEIGNLFNLQNSMFGSAGQLTSLLGGGNGAGGGDAGQDLMALGNTIGLASIFGGDLFGGGQQGISAQQQFQQGMLPFSPLQPQFNPFAQQGQGFQGPPTPLGGFAGPPAPEQQSASRFGDNSEDSFIARFFGQ